MNNVKLEKAKGRGWFLAISDVAVCNIWAVTSEELLALNKILQDNMKDILKEPEEN